MIKFFCIPILSLHKVYLHEQYGKESTHKEIYDDAKGRGFGFISDGKAGSKVSAVFVRLSEGAKADSTAVKITSRIPKRPLKNL